jgi:hypothetical protein
VGHGLVPSPYDGPDPDDPIDDGTRPRIGSPTPTPIGLDAKSPGTPKPSTASMADKIVAYSRRQSGQKVGDGECFTLANTALTNAGAKGAAAYGSVSPDVDYVWGTAVSLADVRPGDVVQFRNYRFDREVVTKKPKEIVTDDDFQERGHHTAIVERVEGNGVVTVLEQNVEGSPVVRTQLFFKDVPATTADNKTTTVKVSGSFWFYRPQPQ